MSLGIDELLRRIGIGNVRLQFLHECLLRANKRKVGCDITFHTREIDVSSFAQDDPATIGIVIWVPYADFRAVQAAWKDEQASSQEKPDK